MHVLEGVSYPLKKSITTPLVGHPALSEIEAKKRKRREKSLEVMLIMMHHWALYLS